MKFKYRFVDMINPIKWWAFIKFKAQEFLDM